MQINWRPFSVMFSLLKWPVFAPKSLKNSSQISDIVKTRYCGLHLFQKSMIAKSNIWSYNINKQIKMTGIHRVFKRLWNFRFQNFKITSRSKCDLKKLWNPLCQVSKKVLFLLCHHFDLVGIRLGTGNTSFGGHPGCCDCGRIRDHPYITY